MNPFEEDSPPVPSKPLKQHLQECSTASPLVKSKVWDQLNRSMIIWAKKGRFTRQVHLHDLGPIVKEDLIRLGFQWQSDCETVEISWSLNNKSNEPPPKGTAARELFDLSVGYIRQLLTKHAVKTGATAMEIGIYTPLSDADRVAWRDVLRREDLDVMHVGRKLIVRW